MFKMVIMDIANGWCRVLNVPMLMWQKIVGGFLVQGELPQAAQVPEIVLEHAASEVLEKADCILYSKGYFATIQRTLSQFFFLGATPKPPVSS